MASFVDIVQQWCYCYRKNVWWIWL